MFFAEGAADSEISYSLSLPRGRGEGTDSVEFMGKYSSRLWGQLLAWTTLSACITALTFTMPNSALLKMITRSRQKGGAERCAGSCGVFTPAVFLNCAIALRCSEDTIVNTHAEQF